MIAQLRIPFGAKENLSVEPVREKMERKQGLLVLHNNAGFSHVIACWFRAWNILFYSVHREIHRVS
jgi:hypothetical protein